MTSLARRRADRLSAWIVHLRNGLAACGQRERKTEGTSLASVLFPFGHPSGMQLFSQCCHPVFISTESIMGVMLAAEILCPGISRARARLQRVTLRHAITSHRRVRGLKPVIVLTDSGLNDGRGLISLCITGRCCLCQVTVLIAAGNAVGNLSPFRR